MFLTSEVGLQKQKRMSMADFSAIDLLGFILFAGLMVYGHYTFWLKPGRIRKKLQLQGISGPPPSLFTGNLGEMRKIREETSRLLEERKHVDFSFSHDYFSYVFPNLSKWRKDYGPTYLYYLGSMPVLYISDGDLVRECLQSKNPEFGRPSYFKRLRGTLLGEGILTVNGPSWVHQRKVIAPEFAMNKVKKMMPLMVDSANAMVKKWERKIDDERGIAWIRIDQDLNAMAAEIICKTLFGSYYSQAKKISTNINNLQDVLSTQNMFIGFPGFRYIPVKSNRNAWRLSREIRDIILLLIEEHKKKVVKEDDLLEVLIENFGSNDLVVDNCKGLLFAGHETSANAATFALLLLAHHTEWQEQISLELQGIQVAGRGLSIDDVLYKMKTLTMVIQETTRLYPATPVISRETTEEVKFGNLEIPKGVTIWMSLNDLHQDPTSWGENASDFDPSRFANGVSGACKSPHVYIPFGSGVHSCLGQNFAMIELKIVLSLVLSKFSFSLHPDYRHEITMKMTLEPKDEVLLVMKKR